MCLFDAHMVLISSYFISQSPVRLAQRRRSFLVTLSSATLHAEVADWESHVWIYRRLCFAIMRGVAEQFDGPVSDTVG